MKNSIKILLALLLCLVIGVAAYQIVADNSDDLEVHVAGLRSLIGEEVKSEPLNAGREEKIYLNERTVIDFHRIDVMNENHIVGIIDFADEFSVEKNDKNISLQEPFFRQIIDLEYEMISETQLQVKNLTIECVSGTENSKIEDYQITLPEQLIYQIDEPISWKLFVDFTSSSYGIFGVLNLDCSVSVKENGRVVFSIYRDADDLEKMREYMIMKYN